jgi:hypothetical protein
VIIDEFLERENWIGERERSQFVSKREDGELYLLPRLTGLHQTEVINIATEWIREPEDQPQKGETFAFGVHREIRNPSKILGYWVNWPDTDDCEYIPAGYVVADKINARRSYPRGISDFAACSREIIGALRLVRGTTLGATLLANIPWIEHAPPGASAAMMQSWREETGTMSFNRTSSSPGFGTRTKTHYGKQVQPGTVRHTEAGRSLAAIPINGNAQYFLDVAKAVFCLGGTIWSMPEYLMLSDATGTVYASALAAEAPFVKNCETEQKYAIQKDKAILKRVIENAMGSAAMWRFGVSIRDVWSLVEVVSSCPRVASRDEEAATRRREVLHNAGLLSKRTWAEIEELDYDQELQRGAKATAPTPMTFEAKQDAAAKLIWEGYP